MATTLPSGPAFLAAVAAFASWKAASGDERGRILRRWNDLILARTEDLARTMTLEMGKPIVETRGEVRYAASFVEYYAEAARRIGGEMLPAPFPHKRFLVRHEPVGPGAEGVAVDLEGGVGARVVDDRDVVDDRRR